MPPFSYSKGARSIRPQSHNIRNKHSGGKTGAPEAISYEAMGTDGLVPSMGKGRPQGAAISNSPEELVRLIGPGKHLILFYESSEHARRLEFTFLSTGLRMGESGLYASSKDDPARVLGEMKSFGIGVDRYLKSGSLRVRKVPDPALDPEGPLHGFREFLNAERGAVAGPLWQVTRLFDPSTEAEVNSIIEIERLVEVSVEGTQDRIVCSFCMKGDLHASFGTWFTEMMKSHDGVVFVPSSSDGVAFSVK